MTRDGAGCPGCSSGKSVSGSFAEKIDRHRRGPGISNLFPNPCLAYSRSSTPLTSLLKPPRFRFRPCAPSAYLYPLRSRQQGSRMHRGKEYVASFICNSQGLLLCHMPSLFSFPLPLLPMPIIPAPSFTLFLIIPIIAHLILSRTPPLIVIDIAIRLPNPISSHNSRLFAPSSAFKDLYRSGSDSCFPGRHWKGSQ